MPNKVKDAILARLANSSQKDLAAELGISPQYFSDIIREKREISPKVAEKLGYQRSWEKIK
jgi:plasmid maintenance system antidote protein VapI